MLQKIKITSYAIILFLFVISFGLATTGSKAEAQVGAALDQAIQSLQGEIQSLQGMISTLTTRVAELEAQANSAPTSHPETFTPSNPMQSHMPSSPSDTGAPPSGVAPSRDSAAPFCTTGPQGRTCQCPAGMRLETSDIHGERCYSEWRNAR